MKNTILDLTPEEARKYFLQAKCFCSIDLPLYFNFQPLLDKLAEQNNCDLQNNGKAVKFDDVNYKFYSNKDGKFAWRPLIIINPASYVNLVKIITEEENWNFIVERFKKFQKDNNIICFSIPLVTLNNENIEKKDTILNWWKQIEQQSIEFALDYGCMLNTDITDCYGSIYTHTIAWALHDKEVAKVKRYDNSLIGNVIDKNIQNMLYGQTNGIPQGSVLMDFIAEMVLGYADLQLSKAIKDAEIEKYKIIRYRDDYRIFAKTQEDLIKIAKLLTEVLTDLNLKINTQKTFVSTNIIRDSIKPDKLYWNEAKHSERTLQQSLLLIHSLAEKYPNSGSVQKALQKFLNHIYPLKLLKNDCSKVLISIAVDIAYNNPRTYPQIVAIIGKILSLESDEYKQDIYESITEKFKTIPNVGHWLIWLQRLTIKSNRPKEYVEKLCQVAAANKNINKELWNISWLKSEIQEIINRTSIIDEGKIEEMPEYPDNNEVDIFIRNQY